MSEFVLSINATVPSAIDFGTAGRGECAPTRTPRESALDSCSTAGPVANRTTGAVGWGSAPGLAERRPGGRARFVDPAYIRHAREGRRPAWFARYQCVLLGIGLAAAAIGSVLAFTLRFGGVPASSRSFNVAFAVLLPLGWVAAVGGCGGYEARFVGVGNAEYERVLRAFAYLSASSAFVFYLFDAPVARGFAFPALGMAMVLDVVGRHCARTVLHRRRRRGASLSSVIAVGGPPSLAAFVTLLHNDTDAGMRVVGACVPADAARDDRIESELAAMGAPVVGDIDSIRRVVLDSDVHTVAVLADDIGSDKLRWVSWQLEGTQTDLVVSPGLADFGGQRLHVQPVAGLPLLHIDAPSFRGVRRVLKNVFDRVCAGLGLVLLSPILLGIALLVRLTSPGPALFRQKRVGKHGQEFTMIKFRSMGANAEQRLAELAELNENDGPLFKMQQDPRVTSVGRRLRRFSLDELPQLLNVMSGSMSLVGPRPPLPSEVAMYGDDVRRRLLVKPGLTGLWQISGRSNLSWEESVRLDLRYIEEWSLSLDMVVLWRTARAVLRSEGAY